MPGWAWVVPGLVAGVVDFWGNRYNLNPDGISYVEMAQHALSSGPHSLINGLWSPGYPALLAMALRVAPAALVIAVPVLHAVNLLLYIAALLLFLQLFRHGVDRDSAPIFARLAAPFAVIAIAWVTLGSIGIGLLTPDLGVCVGVLGAAFCCVQLERSGQQWRWAVILGVTLGLGYWMKGILLPLNALLLSTLIVLPPRIARARAKVALAGAVFALVALPQVVLVSRHVGHVTASEVGRLNYAWQTNDVTPYIGWLGDSARGSGTALHAPRLVERSPLTLEFATPIAATYPLWYDPAYWYAGLRVKINLPGQWRAWKQGVSDTLRIVAGTWPLIAALLLVWLVTSPTPAAPSRGRVPACLGAWSACAALVYSLVHVEPRYLAGFVALATFVVWTELVRRQPRRNFAPAAALAIAVVSVALVATLWTGTGGMNSTYRPAYLAESDSLHAMGIAPGDRVAMVGDAYEAYAAFAAGTPIAAQVLDSAGYWHLAADARSVLERRLASYGVKAILANSMDSLASAAGWHLIVTPDSTNLAVLLLHTP